MVENPETGSLGARPRAAIFEYSRPAFHAIRKMVLDGYRKSPKSGDEVAGLLYGTREANIVRVQAVRRIACEHALGRTLLLSANDKAALKDQLMREATEPALQGLAVVGWFLSHTAPIRTAMTASRRTVLSLSDLQTFDEYFGTPGQATLVLRPNPSATMQASVFLRRADGSVNAEESDLDFPFTEQAAIPDRPESIESKSSAPAVRETAPEMAAAAKAATASASTGRQTVPAWVPATPKPTEPTLVPEVAAVPAEPVPPVRQHATAVSPAQPGDPEAEPAADRWASAEPAASAMPAAPLAADPRDALPAIRGVSPSALTGYSNFGAYVEARPRLTFKFAKFLQGSRGIAGLALLAGLALTPLVVRYYRSQQEPVPISLTASEHDRRIQVRWNHSARVIREAVQGSIEFVDGSESHFAALSADDLSHGNVVYMRETGDVQIRFEVENAKGQKTREVVHFFKPDP